MQLRIRLQTHAAHMQARDQLVWDRGQQGLFWAAPQTRCPAYDLLFLMQGYRGTSLITDIGILKTPAVFLNYVSY